MDDESRRQTQSLGFEQAQPRQPLPVRIRIAGTTHPAYRLHHGSCVVGAGQDVDLVLEDETVSRRHVEVKLAPEGVEIMDLGSRNGTFYLGQRVQHMVLALGSQIRVGRVDLTIEPDDDSLDRLSARKATSYGDLTGGSAAMRHVYGVLERLEGSLASVLVTGESGTGKEVVARVLHERSMVSGGPFVAVNCGALDRALVRAELFGHARGAFTGAVESRAGAFETASGGTLFLDEIGELPIEIQPVLLRVLETGMVQRVGETTERQTKVRLIAATNRNLEDLVKEGSFRQDLYYRLLVVRIQLPPLRDRPDDIAPLVRAFATELGVGHVPDDVMARCESRSWPGNVRELKNTVRAYAALGSLPEAAIGVPGRLSAVLRENVDLSKPYAELKDTLLAAFQQVYLEALMEHTSGNQSEAARVSGIARSHLLKLLRGR